MISFGNQRLRGIIRRVVKERAKNREKPRGVVRLGAEQIGRKSDLPQPAPRDKIQATSALTRRVALTRAIQG